MLAQSRYLESMAKLPKLEALRAGVPGHAPGEALCYSTVRIECQVGADSAFGTGFFFRNPSTDAVANAAFLVTNKHVVEGASSARFVMHQKGLDQRPIAGIHQEIVIHNLPDYVVHHPSPDIDLCAIPMFSEFLRLASAGTELFYVSFAPEIIPSSAECAQLDAANNVVVVGYPTGLWDAHNNMPIVRRGICATHPAKLYEGRPEFLVDAAVHAGSSGAPVLLYDLGFHTTKEGDAVVGSRVRLLGIIYAMEMFTAEGEVGVVQIPTIQDHCIASRIPMNLGAAVQAASLLDFADVAPQVHESVERMAKDLGIAALLSETLDNLSSA